MTGYAWRQPKAATNTPPSGIRLLTGLEFVQLTEDARARRRAHWAGIIRGLALEHDRRYHAHTPGDERTTCKLDGCNRPISRGGLCERDYMRAYRAKKRGEAA